MAIYSKVNPFVSTTRKKLIAKNMRDMAPKKKNTGYDDPTASTINGVTITQIEHPNQFMNVAGGTHLAGIIYGTYSQTTGPIVIP